MHEHIQLSLVLGRRTKGNLLGVFTRFWRLAERAFCGKSPISKGRHGRLKPDEFLNLI